MKKLYITMAAVLTVFSACVMQSFAATSTVTVSAGKPNVSYTYNNESSNAETDALKLFNNFRSASSDKYTSEEFTVTSNNRGGQQVEVFLKLEAEPSENYSPLNYYIFKITDSSGNVIYDGEKEEKADPSDTEKDISFGQFNSQFTQDTKKFTVEYKIDPAIEKELNRDNLGLNVYIASKPIAVIGGTDEPAEIYAASTKTPQTTVAASSKVAEPDLTPSPEPTVTATAEPEKVVKVCGKDISAGRYLVSGNGVVRIESKDGNVKSETTVTDGTVKNVEGVEEFVATITDGDVITATPLAGQQKPSVKFEKTNAAVTSSTAVPSGTSKANTSKTAASKTNPKTGEENAGIVIFSVVMGIAAAGVVALEVIKRKRAAR